MNNSKEERYQHVPEHCRKTWWERHYVRESCYDDSGWCNEKMEQGDDMWVKVCIEDNDDFEHTEVHCPKCALMDIAQSLGFYDYWREEADEQRQNAENEARG